MSRESKVYISELLLSDTPIHQTIEEIYLRMREENASHSLSWICQRAGIKAKGYLSEMMKGKRPVNLNYIEGLAFAFQLSPAQSRVFQIKAEIARLTSKKKTEPERLDYKRKELAVAQKSLRVKSVQIGKVRVSPLIFAKTFCAFGISGAGSTAKELAVAANESIHEVFLALDALVDHGWVEKVGDAYSISDSKQLLFNADDTDFQISLIESHIRDALQNLNTWYKNDDQSYFESSTISVRASDFYQELNRIKQSFNELQSKLESEDADRLIHFNVQIYPDS